MSQNNKKYLAFISYRHADNKEQGRQWATWLHQAIETYDVPADLVGTKNSRGEEIPARIYPIFRDEEELPADADLGRSIVNALDNTRLLIVLCSPRAVASTYVADEIHYFKQSGHSDRIIAAMIDGEPNTSWDKSKLALGYSPEQECFPVPLQYEYDADGVRTNKHAEPIAADFRLNINGFPEQSWTSVEAYKQDLRSRKDIKKQQIPSLLEEYSQQQHLMLLKIIAGILGLPLGELTQRDKEYQLELERKRAAKLRRWLSIVGILAVLAVIASVFAFFKQVEASIAKDQAELQKQRAESSLAEAYAGYGRKELADKQFEEAQLYFLHANQLKPNAVTAEEEFEARKSSLRKVWSTRRGLKFDNLPYITTNARFAVGQIDENAVLYDFDQKTILYSYPLLSSSDYLFLVSENGDYIFEYNLRAQTIRRINQKTGEHISIDGLVERGVTIFWPGVTGNELLVFLTNGDIELIDTITLRTLDRLSGEAISNIEPQYEEALKADWITLFSDMKVVNQQQQWTIITKTGLTLRLSNNRQKASAISNTLASGTQTKTAKLKSSQIEASLFGEQRFNIALSKDGKRMASIGYRSCQFLEGDSEDIDWMRIAKEIDIWDLESRQLIKSISIRWSQDTDFFETSQACKDNDDFEFNLDTQQRSIAGKVNNFLVDMTTFFDSDGGVAVSRDGRIYHLPDDELVLDDHRERRNIDFAAANHGGVVMTESSRSKSKFQSKLESGYWVFRHEKDKSVSESRPLSSVTSFDNRFFTTLYSSGAIQSRSLSDGQVLAEHLVDDLPINQLLCQTENSHEVLLVAHDKITRFNWQTGETIWQRQFDKTNSQLTSCATSLRFNEASIVLTSRESLWSPDASQAVNGNFKLDKESRIIRVSLAGEIKEVVTPNQSGLSTPVLLKYTDVEDQVFIVNLTGALLYNLKLKKTIDFLDVKGGSGERGFPTTIEASPNYLSTYIGYSNGQIYQFTNGNQHLLLDLEMPIIDLALNGKILTINTGVNPKTDLQKMSVALLANDSFRSYSYELNLDTLNFNKTQGYANLISQSITHLFSGNEYLIESTDGSLSYFRKSSIEPINAKSDVNSEKNFFELANETYLEVERTNNGLLITSSMVDRPLMIKLEPNKNFFFSFFADRKWLMLAMESDDLMEVNTYIINTEELLISSALLPVSQAVAERFSTLALNASSSSVISCDGNQCSLYDLSSMSFYPSLPDFSQTPSELLVAAESISGVTFMNQSVVLTTQTGKLEVWQRKDQESSTPDSDSDPDSDSISKSTTADSRSNYRMIYQLQNKFYKNLIYEQDTDRLFAIDRQKGYVFKPDLTLLKVIPVNFSGGHVFAIDLSANWLLFAEKSQSVAQLNARLFDLDTNESLNYFEMDSASFISLNSQNSKDKNALSWSGSDGQIMSFDVARAVAYGRNYAQLKFPEALAFAEDTSSKTLNGVEIHKQPKKYITGLTSSKPHSPVSHSKLARDNVATGEMDIEWLLPPERAYRKTFFRELGIFGSQQWPKSEVMLMDQANHSKPLMFIQSSAAIVNSSNDPRLPSLLQRIENLFPENKDISGYTEELAEIDPDHFFVHFVKMQKLFQVNSYESYQYGLRYLQRVAGYSLYQSPLIETNQSHAQKIMIDGVDQVMLSKFVAGVHSAAVQSGLFEHAHELIKLYPKALTNPQFSQQLFVQLTNLGLYGKAEYVLSRELDNLSSIAGLQQNQRAYQTYQSYLRYQAMLQRYRLLRPKLSNLPLVCLGDIKPGSGIEISEWQPGDCIIEIDGQKPIELLSTFPKLQLASANQSSIGVLRAGQELSLKAPSSLEGGGWNMLGYNGRYVIRIKNVRAGSLAASLGLQAEDYLVAIDDQLIDSPLQIVMRQIPMTSASDSTIGDEISTRKLWVYRPTGKHLNTTPNKAFDKQFSHHPLTYTPGNLIELELNSYDELGASIEMALLIVSKQSNE